MDSPLDVATTGGVQVWTLNQTETGNAITDLSFVEAIERAVDEANENLEVRAIVLTGAGKHFSSGGNVKEMADGQGMFGLDERAQRRAYIAGIQRVPRALSRLEVPIIAA
ncbi:MAG: enoyl-CoA hydratase-related protein, partial [Gordonia amarae]